MTHRVTILGATGSIGKSTAEVLAQHRDRFQVEAVVAGRDAAALAAMARRLGARCAVLSDGSKLAELKALLAGSGIEAGAGETAVLEAAARDADTVVAAIAGVAGLAPTRAALKAGRRIALANKEALVCAGQAFMRDAARIGATILPMDSEHNALAQAMGSGHAGDVLTVTLTASGGPFRNATVAEIAAATPAQTAKHPTYSMGDKINVDSASLMNKGLELIEAHHLFGLALAQLDVVVHAQSIIHGLVFWRDGAVTAGMANPDMKIPIAHCLGGERRLDLAVPRLDLAAIGRFTFEAPDESRFPCLGLARAALDAGGGMPAVLNGANEVAVAAFLAGRARFPDIPRIVEETCAAAPAHAAREPATIEDALALDLEARRIAAGLSAASNGFGAPRRGEFVMDQTVAAFGKVGGLLVYPLAFLFVLTIVVFVHEFGHFWVGRRCGIGVKAFSIGFGKELFGWTDRHGTRWKISAVPLGGYVKFLGDMNAASVPDEASLAAMSGEERARSFQNKPLAARAAVVAAGPVANFILAILVFAAVTFFVGRQVLAPRVETVQAGSAAETAGFRPGDLVLTINGRQIASFTDMQRLVQTSAGDDLAFLVDRGGSRITIRAVPAAREVEVPGFGKQRIGVLGLQGSRDPADQRFVSYGPLESLEIGFQETWNVVDRTFNYLGKLVTGRESPQQLSGPIGIMRVSGDVAAIGGLSPLIGLIAVLSVSIGLINLFPIPLLDGGHLLFYAFEAVRGRPLSDRAQEIGFRIGLAIVVMLMLFATWNDIVHLGASFAARGT